MSRGFPNLKDFNKQMEKWAKKRLPEEVKIFQRAMALHLLRGVVMETPVDEGRARANWQMGVNEQPAGYDDSTDKDGEATINKALAMLANLPNWAIIYVANNLPYIVALEHGHSNKAPEGMLAVSVEKLKAVFGP